MKKIIVIYLLGVIVNWFASMNLINKNNKEYGHPKTYGDVAFVTLLSTFSWIGVVSVTIIEISMMDFWDKPLKN